MILWWTSLSLFMKILWVITLTASLIFIIQSVMTFIGADAGDGGIDADFDGGDIPTDMDAASDMGTGMGLLTFRNFVNFFLGFGWAAVLLHEKIQSTALLMVVAVLIGIALVVAVMYLFKWLSSMQQSGTINVYKQAVGCLGKVYLAIPAARGGSGKVQITIGGAVREYDALTDGETLPTGANIKVIEALDDHTLLVEGQESLII